MVNSLPLLEGDKQMSENTPMISTQNLTMRFEVKAGLFSPRKHITAVDNVNIAIYEGENVALVGESGCGKSTLGRLTLGLLKPTEGSVFYYGKNIWQMSKEEFRDFRKSAQIIHQNPYNAINPMRKIADSLLPPILKYKIAKNRDEAWEKAKELLCMVGLSPPEDFLNRYPARMSGGQMQRILIARALSVNPKYILADEAVSMLDASLRIGVVDLLLDLQKKFKVSYLFVTHDFGIARYFVAKGGGRVMVMYLGSIVEIGPGEEVIQNPIHPYTRTLISAIPIPDPVETRKRGIPPLRSLDIPSLTELPPGCKFSDRCPYASEVCMKKHPELKEVNGRLVACHKAEEFL